MHKSKRDWAYAATLFTLFTLFALFVAVVYIFPRIIEINACQKDILGQVTCIERLLEEQGVLKEGIAGNFEAIYDLEKHVSISMSIITAGIAVFALFGGVLSLFNISRVVKIQDAIHSCEKLQEDQQELQSARLVQQGRVYAMRKHNAYAIDCFRRAKQRAPETFNALMATYEELELYADVLAPKPKSLSLIEEKYYELIWQIESHKDHRSDCKALKGDAFFLMGCLYGVYGKHYQEYKGDYLQKSIKMFRESLKCSGENAELYKNRSLTYAMLDNLEKCKSDLQAAIDCAKDEPIEETRVSAENLKELYMPFMYVLSPRMKEMLNQEFFCEEL